MRNGLTQESGVNIVIHKSTVPPNLVSSVKSIASGTFTRIALTEHRLRRLPKPYRSKCLKIMPSILKEQARYEYSQHHCKAACYTKLVEIMCKCIQSKLTEGMMDYGGNETKVSYCQLKDLPCLSNLLERMSDRKKSRYCSKCGPDCNLTEYQVVCPFKLVKSREVA